MICLRNILAPALLLLFLSAVGAQPALADWKPYAFSYSYRTIGQGIREIEFYTDLQTKGGNYSLKNQFELEYGITNSWMCSVYGVFSGSSTQSYKYSETKLQTRYRFGETGQYWMDPAVYLELKIPTSGNQAVEFKEILSKDFGEYNITTNIIFEKVLSSGSELGKGYSLALGRKITPKLRLALEAKGDYGTANPTFYVGPSIFARLGPVNSTLIVSFGQTPASNTLYIRNIISALF
ncbi:MAG: hypothetical protein WC645_07095 [Candidatus Margulisiibacteriota bacterium]